MRILRNLLLVSITLLLCLSATEITLQICGYPKNGWPIYIYSPIAGVQYAPNLDTWMVHPIEYKIHFKTNDRGLRDDEILPDKKGYRILFLGDSLVSGHGVEKEETFADQLERELPAEIINAGTAGFELINDLRYFRYTGKDFRPDLTVLFLYLGNDLMNREWIIDETGGVRNKNWPVPDEPKISALKTVQLWKSRFSSQLSVGHRDPFREWEPGSYLVMFARDLSESARADYRESERLVDELRRDVVASGSRFLVVLLPCRTAVDPAALERFREKTPNFDKAFDFDMPRQKLIPYLHETNIDYVDLAPEMRIHYQETGEPLYFYYDGHLNRRGHAFLADHLKDALKGP